MVGRMSGQGGTSGALAVLPIVFPSPIFEKILIAKLLIVLGMWPSKRSVIFWAGENWRQCFRAAASGDRIFYCALAAPHVATMTALKTSNDCKLTRHRMAGSGVMLSVSPAATLCDFPLMLSNTLSLAGGPTIPTVKCPSPTISV